MLLDDPSDGLHDPPPPLLERINWNAASPKPTLTLTSHLHVEQSVALGEG